jgi:hypothetical protein
MFRKSTIIKGLTLLLVVEVLVGVGLGMEWKSIVSEKQTANREQKEVEEATVKVKQTQTVVQEEPEANRIAREIIEDYNKKMADILETYREKSKPIREKIEFLITKANEMWKMGDEAEYYRLNEELDKLLKKEYQLQLWKEEQERLLKQERERREEEFAKKYLENYVSKEILFLPWGSGEGKIGLYEENMGPIQGVGPDYIYRSCATGIAIDKNLNIYLTDGINKRIQKFNKEGRLINTIKTSSNCRVIEIDKEGNVYVLGTVAKEDIVTEFLIEKISHNFTKTYSINPIKTTYKIRQYKGDGKWEPTLIDFIPERIWVDSRDNILISDNKLLFGIVLIGTKKQIFTFDQMEKVNSITKQGFNYQYNFYKKDHSRKMVLYNIQNKKITESLTIDDSEIIKKFNLKGSLYLKQIDFDKEGNVYLVYSDLGRFGYELSRYGKYISEPTLLVLKLNKKGQLVAKIEMPAKYWVEDHIPQFVEITDDGNIYQLLAEREGLHILKWEVR